MSFRLVWAKEATQTFNRLQEQARAVPAAGNGGSGKRQKSSKQAGLFKQVAKAIEHLKANPRHPSLNTHEYTSLTNPYDADGKVFEAYAQNKTPGAYRIFWCYGPEKGVITILAITPHP